MERKAFCILVAMIACILVSCTSVTQDENADVFIDSYLSSYESLVEYLTEDYSLYREETKGTYTIWMDYESLTIKGLLRLEEGKNGQIVKQEIIEALNAIDESTYYPLDTIYVTDERITFVAGEGMEGIVYMKSDKKPGYFIAPDEAKTAHYHFYRVCDHWYRAESRRHFLSQFF